MNGLKAELFFLFRKRNRLCFVLMCMGLTLLGTGQERAYAHRFESQAHQCRENLALIQSNLDFLALEQESGTWDEGQEALKRFWERAYALCFQLYCDWTNHEPARTIAAHALAWDEALWSALEEGLPIQSYASLLLNTRDDLEDRIRVARASLEAGNTDFLMPQKPTGFGLVFQLFQPRNGGMFVILLCLLLMNADSWSREFEQGMFKTLFTSPRSRGNIFWLRTLCTGMASVLVYGSGAAFLFLFGTCLHGVGSGQLVATREGVAAIGKVVQAGIVTQMTDVLFWSVCAQCLSWWTKETGIVLMVGLLVLMGMMVFPDSFSWVFCQSLLYTGSRVVWVLMPYAFVISFLTEQHVARCDLKGAEG